MSKYVSVKLTIKQAEYLREDMYGLAGSCDSSWQSRLYFNVADKIAKALAALGGGDTQPAPDDAGRKMP